MFRVNLKSSLKWNIKVKAVLTAFLCYINSINFDKRPDTTVEMWPQTITLCFTVGCIHSLFHLFPDLLSISWCQCAADFHSTSWKIWHTPAFFSLFSLIPKNHCPCLQILLHLTTEEFSTRRCRPEDCDFDPLSLEHKDFSWFLETFTVMYCRKLFYFTLKTILLELFHNL